MRYGKIRKTGSTGDVTIIRPSARTPSWQEGLDTVITSVITLIATVEAHCAHNSIITSNITAQGPPPVSEMTYTVSSGMLNPSIPYHSPPPCRLYSHTNLSVQHAQWAEQQLTNLVDGFFLKFLGQWLTDPENRPFGTKFSSALLLRSFPFKLLFICHKLPYFTHSDVT